MHDAGHCRMMYASVLHTLTVRWLCCKRVNARRVAEKMMPDGDDVGVRRYYADVRTST